MTKAWQQVCYPALWFPLPRWGALQLADRYTLNIVKKANVDAIHLMTLGFVSEANQILEVLRSHGELDFGDLETKTLMHFAWHASGKWPDWLNDAGHGNALTPPTKHSDDEIINKIGKEFAEEMIKRKSAELKKELRKDVRKDLLISVKGKKESDIKDAHLEDDNSRDRNLPGEEWIWVEEDLDKLYEQAKELKLDPYRRRNSQSRIVSGAVEAALELKRTDIARETLKLHLAKLFNPMHEEIAAEKDEQKKWDLQRFDEVRLSRYSLVLDSPMAWKFLIGQIHDESDAPESPAGDGGWLAGQLNISLESVEDWLMNTLQILETRLKDGRRGPYSDLSIRDLCTVFDEMSLKLKRCGKMGQSFSAEDLGEDEEPPTTVLHPAVAKDAITKFEHQLQQEVDGKWPNGLPSQYKEFLGVTDGIYVGQDGRTNGEVLCPLANTETRSDELLGFPNLMLLPINTGVNTIGDKVPGPEWPEIGNSLFIGAGGDEGDHLIVPRPALEAGLEYMITGWAADNDQYVKREWERAIRDILYVDLKGVKNVEEARMKLQDIDFVIMQGYHWRAEVICFRFFRDLLEDWMEEMWRETRKDKDDDDKNEDDDEDDASTSKASSATVSAHDNDSESDNNSKSEDGADKGEPSAKRQKQHK